MNAPGFEPVCSALGLSLVLVMTALSRRSVSAKALASMASCCWMSGALKMGCRYRYAFWTWGGGERGRGDSAAELVLAGALGCVVVMNKAQT